MKSFAVILLATAVFAAPKGDLKKQDKRSLTGISDYGLSSGLGLSAYSTGLNTKLHGSGIALGNTLPSGYSSGLGTYGGTYGGSYGSIGDSYGSIGDSYGSIGGSNILAYNQPNGGEIGGLTGFAPALSRGISIPSISTIPSSHPKIERITGVTVHREIQVPVPVPQPIPVEVTRHVPVPHPVPVKVDRPYPVPVPQPVPVTVIRHVPVKVDRPYPVPVAHPVEVRVPQPIAVPVAQPVPVPVSITRHVPVSVVPSIATSGISSGQEYFNLGHSSLASGISGAALSAGLIDNGAISGGIIGSSGLSDIGISTGNIRSTFGSPLLTSSYGAADGGYAYSGPLKKW